MILAGDIGGTNSRLAIFDPQFVKVHESVTKNAGRTNFTDIVREFLAAAPKEAVKQIRKGCCGVAGPVAGGKVTLTNLSWQLDETVLAKDLGLEQISLINDLVAHAEGIELLKPDQIVTLNAGQAVPGGNRAIIAAGTGLGEAGLVWSPRLNGYRLFPAKAATRILVANRSGNRAAQIPPTDQKGHRDVGNRSLRPGFEKYLRFPHYSRTTWPGRRAEQTRHHPRRHHAGGAGQLQQSRRRRDGFVRPFLRR